MWEKELFALAVHYLNFHIYNQLVIHAKVLQQDIKAPFTHNSLNQRPVYSKAEIITLKTGESPKLVLHLSLCRQNVLFYILTVKQSFFCMPVQDQNFMFYFNNQEI